MLRAQVPTHSALQPPTSMPPGCCCQRLSTADVIGGWATAANRCLASAVVDGSLLHRRLVTPRFGDHLVLPGPTAMSGSSWTTSGCISEVGAGGLSGP